MKKELTSKEKREYIFVIQLVSYVFGNRTNVKIPTDVDWKSVYTFSQKNKITNIVSYALESLGVDLPVEVKKVFTSDRKFLLMKDASQFAATQKVLSAFEKSGIDHLLVKGQFIKDTYPQPDYRVTTDVDIHINIEKLSKAKEITESLGFRTVVDGKKELIVNQPPFVEIEIHGDNGNFTDTVFSDDILKNAGLKVGSEHTYEFSINDHYVYIVEHFAKHYRDSSGMGIRMVMDMYCLYNALKEKLDFNYLTDQLKKSGTYKFNHMLIEKGKKYFESDFTDFDAVDIFILSNGFMGNREVLTYNMQRNFEKENGKTNNFFFNRLFPPKNDMADEYPVLNKAGILLPVTWMCRWGKLAFGKDRKIHYNSIKVYNTYNDNAEFEYLKRIMRESGFEDF